MATERAAGEGTLRQRVDKFWEWRIPSGFPVKKSFTAKRQEGVLAKRDAFLKDFGEGVDFDAQRITVAGFFETWLETTVRLNTRPATHEHHARIARIHVLPTLGHLKLVDLTPAHVQTLYAAKFDAGYALSTRRPVHVTLGKALKQAVRNRGVRAPAPLRELFAHIAMPRGWRKLHTILLIKKGTNPG